MYSSDSFTPAILINRYPNRLCDTCGPHMPDFPRQSSNETHVSNYYCDNRPHRCRAIDVAALLGFLRHQLRRPNVARGMCDCCRPIAKLKTIQVEKPGSREETALPNGHITSLWLAVDQAYSFRVCSPAGASVRFGLASQASQERLSLTVCVSPAAHPRPDWPEISLLTNDFPRTRHEHYS
jgi:hypothetical protein